MRPFKSLIAPLLCTVLLTIPSIAAAETNKPSALITLSPRDISEFRGVNEVEFIWLKDPRASSYRIELAKDRRFKHIVHENTEVRETSYVIGDLDWGTYFFRVYPLQGNGGTVESSETLSLIIVPPPPVKTPEIAKE